MGGVTGYSWLCGRYKGFWNYLSAVQYFLELYVRVAIRPTTWNFMCLAQYDRPPLAPRSLTVARESALATLARFPARYARVTRPPTLNRNAKALASSAFGKGKCPPKGSLALVGYPLAGITPFSALRANTCWLWVTGAPPSICFSRLMIIILNKMRKIPGALARPHRVAR